MSILGDVQSCGQAMPNWLVAAALLVWLLLIGIGVIVTDRHNRRGE